VVVIHEIFGLTDDVRALSDRMAALGYLALAPDFYRGGRWSRCMRGAFRELEAGRRAVLRRDRGGARRLAADPRCTGEVGVAGFCLGGSFALLAAARYPFAVACVNYGEVPDDAGPALAGACPVVASYGGRDRTLRGRPERLGRALAANGVDHDVRPIRPRGTAFLAERPYPLPVAALGRVNGMHLGPHRASAEDAWRRIDAFFARHLAAAR
jgi:carboxymethylenebutenolidase